MPCCANYDLEILPYKYILLYKNKDTHKIILMFDAVSLALVIGASSAALVALVRQVEMSRCTTCSFCGAKCERAPVDSAAFTTPPPPTSVVPVTSTDTPAASQSTRSGG